MIDHSFAQVETFSFDALSDRSRHASSIGLTGLLFGSLDTLSGSAPGRYPTPVRLSAFTIALRKRSSRTAAPLTA
jgi:hypothetical protein